MLAIVGTRAYTPTVTKRTSLNLDFELLAEAKRELGTSGTTETVHRALHEVVRQARLRRLAKRRFDFSNDEIEAAELAELSEEPVTLRGAR
jgi:Arc/MetJ family transcription regulator